MDFCVPNRIIDACETGTGKIDRQAVVEEIAEVTEFEKLSSLSVGAAILPTQSMQGLQTFPGLYSAGVPWVLNHSGVAQFSKSRKFQTGRNTEKL